MGNKKRVSIHIAPTYQLRHFKSNVLKLIANFSSLPASNFVLLISINSLYLGLFIAPEDYQQGQAFRIIYVHVPSAWLSLFAYSTLWQRYKNRPGRAGKSQINRVR